MTLINAIPTPLCEQLSMSEIVSQADECARASCESPTRRHSSSPLPSLASRGNYEFRGLDIGTSFNESDLSYSTESIKTIQFEPSWLSLCCGTENHRRHSSLCNGCKRCMQVNIKQVVTATSCDTFCKKNNISSFLHSIWLAWYMCTSVQGYTHIYACIHIRVGIQTDIYLHTGIPTYMCVDAYIYVWKYVGPNMHTCTWEMDIMCGCGHRFSK